MSSFFHLREVPWYGVGTAVDGVLTASEAVVAAGLDWSVEKEQVERKGKPVPDKFWNVRSSDDKILSMVSGGFNNLQNRDAFTFADNLVDSGTAKYESAGELRGGKGIFMVMKVPADINVKGDDGLDLYMILKNGHDGSMAVTVEITPIRLACTNMMKLASTKAVQRWSIRHTSKMEGKLLAARESLNLTFNYAEEFVTIGNQLVDTRITDDMLKKLLDDTLPNRPKTPDTIDAIMHNFNESDNIANYRETGWGALNAFTEYMDHGRDTRSQEAIFQNLMSGEIASQRDKLAQGLLAMA